MPKKPLRKIHRFGPSGRFTRKQIRDAIEEVKRMREQGALEALTERARERETGRETQVARAG